MRLPHGPLLVVLLALLAPPVRAQLEAPGVPTVRYEMDVTVLADRHRLRGTQRLVYTNTSPDTLRRVFYHLYFNAFQPGSMMAERNRVLPDPDDRVVPRIFELDEREIGFHEVLTLAQDGTPLDYRVTDTVLRVNLARPLPPGASTTLEMTFRSQVPLQTRRSGRDNREGIDFSMTQWYPKMAMYDHRGWHADPYVGREFYAPFGTFDVRLTLPADYVVGATGVLRNAAQVGHGYAGTPAGPATDADSLTWHFVAERVHDFAWSADPDYLHDEVVGPMGVTYHLLYQPDVADRWEPMTRWTPALINFFSSEYGPYPYPQFTVAQGGDGGMEYPMITLITGRRSPASLFGVTAHEAAHLWFYGVVGTNEADYAWLDEGFASYADTEARRLVYQVDDPSHLRSYLSVLYAHDQGLFERINTPSDWFATNSAYGAASYSAGAMLIEMLAYVIGEASRDAWLREYYRRYAFRHPDPYAVEKTAEDVSGLRLDWYFEQFGNTTWTLDYAVDDVDRERTPEGHRTTVELEREGRAVMPVDLRLTLADGSEQWVNIPLGLMQGHKPVPNDWIVADPWLWTSEDYVLTVETAARVEAVEIDPLGLTPETDRLDNTARFPFDAAFLRPPRPDWFHYSLGWRPLAQAAHDFGFGGGLRAEGTYLFGDHEVETMVKLWPEVLFSGGDEPTGDVNYDDSWTAGVDFEAAYETDLPHLGGRTRAGLDTRKHLGFMESRAWAARRLSPPLAKTERTLTLTLAHQYAPWDRAFTGGFPFDPFLDENMLSARLALHAADGPDHVELGVEVGGSFTNQLECRSPDNEPVPCTVEVRQRATHAYVAAAKGVGLGPFRARAALSGGLGVESLALHKRFRLGAPSFEQAWRSDAFRGIESVFARSAQDAHLFALAEAGPVAYLLAAARAEDDDATGTLPATPQGTSMLAGTLALEARLPGTSRWLRPLRLSLFSGAGTTWGISSQQERSRAGASGFGTDRIVADAGFGLSYDVGALRPLRRWTAQSDVLSGLHLDARFPVWASDPGLIERGQEPFAWRWLVGLRVAR